MKNVMFTVSRSVACSLHGYGTSNQVASIFRVTWIIVGYCGAFESNG